MPGFQVLQLFLLHMYLSRSPGFANSFFSFKFLALNLWEQATTSYAFL